MLSELDALSHHQIGDVLGVRAGQGQGARLPGPQLPQRGQGTPATPRVRRSARSCRWARGAALRRANLRRHLRDCGRLPGVPAARSNASAHGLRALLPVFPTVALKQGPSSGTAAVGRDRRGGHRRRRVRCSAARSKGAGLKALIAALALSAGAGGDRGDRGQRRPQARPPVGRRPPRSAGTPPTAAKAHPQTVKPRGSRREWRQQRRLVAARVNPSIPRGRSVGPRRRPRRPVRWASSSSPTSWWCPTVTCGRPPWRRRRAPTPPACRRWRPFPAADAALPPLAPGTASAAATTRDPCGELTRRCEYTLPAATPAATTAVAATATTTSPAATPATTPAITAATTPGRDAADPGPPRTSPAAVTSSQLPSSNVGRDAEQRHTAPARGHRRIKRLRLRGPRLRSRVRELRTRRPPA